MNRTIFFKNVDAGRVMGQRSVMTSAVVVTACALLFAGSVQLAEERTEPKTRDPVADFQEQVRKTQAAFESEQKQYAAARDTLIQADAAERFAGTSTMSEEETLARQYFDKLQAREIAAFRQQGTPPHGPTIFSGQGGD